jgi:hypothetical protein
MRRGFVVFGGDFFAATVDSMPRRGIAADEEVTEEVPLQLFVHFIFRTSAKRKEPSENR